VNVNGACDLYGLLKSEQSRSDGNPDIAWNFTKFLVDGEGRVVARYEPRVTPAQIADDLANRL